MSVRVVLLMVSVFLLCCLAGPLAFGEGKKLLDAGPGEEPFDVTKHAVPLKEIQDGVDACIAARYIVPVQDSLRHVYAWNPKLTEETLRDSGSAPCISRLHS